MHLPSYFCYLIQNGFIFNSCEGDLFGGFSLAAFSFIFLCPQMWLSDTIIPLGRDREEARITLPISEMRKLRHGIFLGPELEMGFR